MERFISLLIPRRPVNRMAEFGFTIIEVLIVLAIVGLIMLIVFLAVPALQRNNRDTGYRREAGQIAAAAREFIDAHNLNLPVSTNATELKNNANLKNITSLVVQTNSVTSHTFSNAKTAYYITGVKCPVTVSGASVTPVAAAVRSKIVLFAVETFNGVAAQCMAG